MDTQNKAKFEAGDTVYKAKAHHFWYLLAKFPGWETSKMSCTLSVVRCYQHPKQI